MNDTVFDEQMKPVFCDRPEVVRMYLNRNKPPEYITKVLVGETNVIMSVGEYLYRDKFVDVHRQILELFRKRDMPLYKKDPKLFDEHVARTVRRIIDRVSKQ